MELEQRERVAARITHDPIAHTFIEPARHGGGEQRACVVLRQPFDEQLRQTGERAGGAPLAHGDDHSHRLRHQPPRDEPQHLVRRVVEPLRVVDQDDERAFFRDLRDQRQCGEADEKRIGCVSVGNPEGGGECVTLRFGQGVEGVEHGRAQLMQGRVRQLHF